MIRYFSMFSGVGGFEIGIKKAHPDWECIGVSEIDKFSNELLKQKYPEVKNYGDATKIKPEELPDFDVLCGGFPCQSFSIAGKRGGFEDTRGTMFFEIARIVKRKQPRLLFLENVKGLLNHDGGNTFTKILQTIDELGYDAEWQVLNSKHFGVSQNRERVFIIGHIRGEPFEQVFPIREDAAEIQGVSGTKEKAMISNCSPREAKFREICSCLAARDYKDSKIVSTYTFKSFDGSSKEDGRAIREHKNENESSCLTSQMGSGGNNVPMIYDNQGRKGKMSISEVCPTLRKETHGNLPMVVASRGRNKDNPSDRTPGNEVEQRFEPNSEGTSNCLSTVEKDNYVATNKLRRLTPKECQRLQGFPDNFYDGIEMSDTQKYKQMGNAVTVNVIEAIAKRLCL